jgi:Zn-dependent protease
VRLAVDLEVRRRATNDVARSAGWAITCIIAALFVACDVHLSVRPPLVLVAMICGPGWALCSFLHMRDKGLLWSVAISTGLAVNVTLGLAMIATNTWRPIGASALLLFGSAVVLASRALAITIEVSRRDRA